MQIPHARMWLTFTVVLMAAATSSAERGRQAEDDPGRVRVLPALGPALRRQHAQAQAAQAAARQVARGDDQDRRAARQDAQALAGHQARDAAAPASQSLRPLHQREGESPPQREGDAHLHALRPEAPAAPPRSRRSPRPPPRRRPAPLSPGSYSGGTSQGRSVDVLPRRGRQAPAGRGGHDRPARRARPGKRLVRPARDRRGRGRRRPHVHLDDDPGRRARPARPRTSPTRSAAT